MIEEVWLLSYEGMEQQEIHLELSTIVDRITQLRLDGYVEEGYQFTVEIKNLIRT